MTKNAKIIIDSVWNYFDHVISKGVINYRMVFTSALYVLYGYHKKYTAAHRYDYLDELFLDGSNDNLLHDLFSCSGYKEFDKKHYDNREKTWCNTLYEDLSTISHEEFESAYIEVLQYIFEFISENNNIGSDFYTPNELNELMAYFVKKECCKTIYDPFCGTASIVNSLCKNKNTIYFAGHEIDSMVSLYARVFCEACLGNDKSIKCCDSITEWSKKEFDAVVSFQPLGYKFNSNSFPILQNEESPIQYKSFDEMMLIRPFMINKAKVTVSMQTIGFCYKGNTNYEIRKHLIDNNYIDTIIILPSNILYGTSVSCIIVVCKNNRSPLDPITFINAESYYINENRKKRFFDFNRFKKTIESGNCDDYAKVSIDEVKQFDYNLTPSLYFNRNFTLKDGQNVVMLSDLISSKSVDRTREGKFSEAVTLKCLNDNFIDILKNKNQVESIQNKDISLQYRHVDVLPNEKLLLTCEWPQMKLRLGLMTNESDFVFDSKIKVHLINEDLVTPEYLVYILTENKTISSFNVPLSVLGRLPIVIDSIENQKEIVRRLVQQYNEKSRKEQEADAERLGVKRQISDIEHMLGPTQNKINKIIKRLGNIDTINEKYHLLVKNLKDNVEYMNRLIQYADSDIAKVSFNLQNGNIIEFVESYADGWRNYGGEYFELATENLIENPPMMEFDKNLLKVMLDSIMNNAVRHGFVKRKDYTDHNLVKICLSTVEYNDKPYVLMRVSNNGEPINDSFTIEDYVSRGRYTSSTGRSGLGGFHIYQVVKGHNGYLCLDRNKIWNVIIDILLPVKQLNNNILTSYENECI